MADDGKTVVTRRARCVAGAALDRQARVLGVARVGLRAPHSENVLPRVLRTSFWCTQESQSPAFIG